MGKIQKNLQTALVNACYEGNARKAALLIKSGANPNKADGRGYSPIHFACQENKLNVLKMLLKFGADLESIDEDRTPLFTAAGWGYLQLVRFLIKKGGNANAKNKFYGGTPLHTACAWGHLLIAKELVKGGANINARDEEGRSPIFFAALYRHSSIVAFLIREGAKLNRKSKKGETLLGIAQRNKDKKTVAMLRNTIVV